MNCSRSNFSEISSCIVMAENNVDKQLFIEAFGTKTKEVKVYRLVHRVREGNLDAWGIWTLLWFLASSSVTNIPKLFMKTVLCSAFIT